MKSAMATIKAQALGWDKSEETDEFSTSLITQSVLLTHRMLLNQWRKPAYIYSKIWVHVIQAILIGFTFFQLKTSPTDLQSRYVLNDFPFNLIHSLEAYCLVQGIWCVCTNIPRQHHRQSRLGKVLRPEIALGGPRRSIQDVWLGRSVQRQLLGRDACSHCDGHDLLLDVVFPDGFASWRCSGIHIFDGHDI